MAFNQISSPKIIGLFCLVLLQCTCGRGFNDIFEETENAKGSIKNQSTLYEGGIMADVLAKSGHPKSSPPALSSPIVVHYAAYQSKEGIYNGVQATLDIYNLNVPIKGQLSSSQIWISTGKNAGLNSIQAGWHVYPSHYGNSKSHFFVSWTSKGYIDGCYNLQCPGFVLDQKPIIRPGDILTARNIYLKIYKDKKTGDWWLFGNNQPIGYWPKRLFTTLGGPGTIIALGGMVSYFQNQPSPPMGNGNLPNAGSPSAQIRNIKFINAQGSDQYPFPADFTAVQDDHQCYKISPVVDSKLHDGYYFNYGGRGGCMPIAPPPQGGPTDIVHYAAYNSKEGIYNGVEATVDVYNLNIAYKNQLSTDQIWLSNGQNANQNSIQAGWHVYPSHYGDSRTRFFVAWTSKGFKDGCYNLECPGFVLDRKPIIKPGDILTFPSIFLKISKNMKTGDWWLFVNNGPVGYWPKRLFTTLGGQGTTITFGGMVSFVKNQPSPPMGAGTYPDPRSKSAQIRNIRFINQHGNAQYPFPADFTAMQDDHMCYKISPVVDSKLHDGYYFNFGGRGGCLS